ncbi:tol-pal system protein YbgF [Coxiella burnetii]|uniref:Cell division coordinator CpoB n=2 Tax=Coxiella burnetii TaxID=777 RepID=Q83F57_COXBU|nr:tol-pal system protein YbgF [Coxiella burnetii]NP_819144.2 tol system periplasmic component [Coxiella burnetii RSA 493]AAO89658.2 tol system periplasmic component [Coxiella burnetii RSA 493]ARI65011.1 tol-pal system protein YbgF [Coxiella burnetii]ARK26513.1 tol-pal system protein YbgF [Coxiella burnetii]MCF2093090.1 tol-pal system protein YbgF [Coxiella burnetii]MCF2095182.1 tol-pal system protein YbgF [Coxiella burnetii]
MRLIKMKIKTLCVSSALAALMLSAPLTWADAPVEDISAQPQPTKTTVSPSETPETAIPTAPVSLPTTQTDLTVTHRLARLEQQLNNIINMNLPQQISDLQQRLAQVRGQLQVQERNLELLNNQQRSFYRDLDQRITQLKNLNSNNSDSSNDNSASSSQKPSSGDTSNTNNIQLQDSNTYRQALDLLTKKQYDKAQASFQNYLNDYPNGSYVANAHYWLGEIYLQQKDRKNAAHEFQTVRDKFPKSEKVLDAKLKLAIIDAEDGKIKQAKEELTEIKKQHPESTAAQLANIRLQQLEEVDSATTTP